MSGGLLHKLINNFIQIYTNKFENPDTSEIENKM